MISTKTAVRLTLGTAVTLAALLGTTGCALIAPQATLIKYDPAEGVSADLGDVQVRNAEAVQDPDTGAISIVFAAINTGDITTLHVAAGKGGADKNISVPLAADSTTIIGEPDSTTIVVTSPTDAPAGSLYPVTLQAGSADSVIINVPVLTDDGRPFLEPFVP